MSDRVTQINQLLISSQYNSCIITNYLNCPEIFFVWQKGKKCSFPFHLFLQFVYIIFFVWLFFVILWPTLSIQPVYFFFQVQRQKDEKRKNLLKYQHLCKGTVRKSRKSFSLNQCYPTLGFGEHQLLNLWENYSKLIRFLSW